MNISWPGRITPEGIIHPVFQGIGLKKIKRDITSRLRAAGGPSGVIRECPLNKFAAAYTVALKEINPFTQPFTATLAPEFVSVIRDAILTAGVNRHRHQPHAF